MPNNVVSFDDEKLILVDKDDNVLGYKDKLSCHEGDGILHRAFSIFIFNKKKQLLLQKRSDQKLLWPLFWSNSCCSHPRQGEDYETAIHRRLKEELNIDTELKNLPWQQDKKQQIVQHLQPAKVEEINAMIQSSPMAVIQLADIYSRFNPETKQFDLSDLELKQESKKNLEMKDNAKKAKLDSILSKVKSGKNNVASSQQSGFFNQFEKTN